MENTTEQLQPIIQLLPEEYQGMAMTFLGIITGVLSLYFLLIAPIMAKKQTNAINENMITEEQIGLIVQQKVNQSNITYLKAKIVEFQLKLPFATDETRPLLEAEILRLEEELRQCLS